MGSADRFDSSGTLGIEEEYFVVDADARPTAGTDELVHESDPPAVLAGRLDHELFKFVIEAQTRTLSGLAEAPDALAEMRGALVGHAADHGHRIAAAGLHPTARWRELERVEKPRYREQLDRIQYPQHRNTTAGLHVHVGVDDSDAAVWIADELRWFLPVVLALSANSPYWCGFDTGLASARAKIFENLPTTGIPTAFGSYDAFDAFERRLLETDSITDRGEIWWDVRPHSGLGTVEVRVPDAQAATDRVLALVEYVHALVTDRRAAYDALDDPWRSYRSPAGGAAGGAGEAVDSGAVAADPARTARAHPALGRAGGEPIGPSAGPGEGRVGDCRHELLVENKWRALRYGHDAAFLTTAGGTVPLGSVVEREADRLGVTGIRELAAADSGARAQRRRREADGVDALCESLVLSP